MGRFLEEQTRSSPEAIRIVHEPTKGSLDNISFVLSHPRSFGIAQEDYLSMEEISPRQIKIVAPLYDERVHIVYGVLPKRREYVDIKTALDLLQKPGESDDAIDVMFATAGAPLESLGW